MFIVVYLKARTFVLRNGTDGTRPSSESVLDSLSRLQPVAKNRHPRCRHVPEKRHLQWSVTRSKRVSFPEMRGVSGSYTRGRGLSRTSIQMTVKPRLSTAKEETHHR